MKNRGTIPSGLSVLFVLLVAACAAPVEPESVETEEDIGSAESAHTVLGTCEALGTTVEASNFEVGLTCEDGDFAFGVEDAVAYCNALPGALQDTLKYYGGPDTSAAAFCFTYTHSPARRTVSYFGCCAAPAAPPGATCAHDVCEAGEALSEGCNSCVTDICAVDPFCCETAWDGICIDEVYLVCGSSACGY